MSDVRDPYQDSYPPSLWTVPPEIPPPEIDPTAQTSEFTIAEIQAWVDDHPDEADEVLATEQARDEHARSTLISWLQGYISSRDDGIVVDEDANPQDEE